MSSDELYANYRLTARLELQNKPGMLAVVTTLLAKHRANIGAIDIVSSSREKVIRDITFDVNSELHGKTVIDSLYTLKSVRVLSVSDHIFLLHLGGKLEVRSKYPLNTRNRLSMAYTPGVARVSLAIAEDRTKVHALTIKKQSVAVVSDGSAVLGLGNLGAEAALPVMEGKAMIFKEFANIDACSPSTKSSERFLARRNIRRVQRFINHRISTLFQGLAVSSPRLYICPVFPIFREHRPVCIPGFFHPRGRP